MTAEMGDETPMPNRYRTASVHSKGDRMSAKQAAIPSDRRHRASGQAVVTLNGVDR